MVIIALSASVKGFGHVAHVRAMITITVPPNHFGAKVLPPGA
jgi:hypothetical protein